MHRCRCGAICVGTTHWFACGAINVPSVCWPFVETYCAKLAFLECFVQCVFRHRAPPQRDFESHHAAAAGLATNSADGATRRLGIVHLKSTRRSLREPVETGAYDHFRLYQRKTPFGSCKATAWVHVDTRIPASTLNRRRVLNCTFQVGNTDYVLAVDMPKTFDRGSKAAILEELAQTFPSLRAENWVRNSLENRPIRLSST